MMTGHEIVTLLLPLVLARALSYFGVITIIDTLLCGQRAQMLYGYSSKGLVLEHSGFLINKPLIYTPMLLREPSDIKESANRLCFDICTLAMI